MYVHVLLYSEDEVRVKVGEVMDKTQKVQRKVSYIYIYFFYKCFDQMWLNEEARIAQVANINQLPGTNSFTSPPKYVVMNTSSFLRVELSTLLGEKSLTLLGLKPATFRLQASTLTSRPVVPP